MPDVSLVLQDPQQGANGRIARSVGQGGLDFGGGRPAALVQCVHDLAFPSAMVVFGAHK